MQIDLPSLDFESLKRQYFEASEQLKATLLNGAAWEEVQEIRHHVTDLEAALDKNIRSKDFNPA